MRPPPLEDRVREWLAGYPPGRRYLIGVSGGRDSMVLLRLLHGAGFRRLLVCHLDHGLRGRESRLDARFVEREAGRLGLEFAGERADVSAVAIEHRCSIETAGRRARYAFFARVAKRARCRSIFLAHHADDRVETFLFNLLRGAGPGGLSGMREVTSTTVEGTSLTLLRPLLGVWRAEIDEFAEGSRLRFREDSTNRCSDATRNRLRHEALPALARAMGRDVRVSLWRAAELLAAEDDWATGRMSRFQGELLSAGELRAMHPAEQRRVILAWLRACSVPDVGYSEIESVRALVEKERPAKVNLPGCHFARRSAGRLYVE